MNGRLTIASYFFIRSGIKRESSSNTVATAAEAQRDRFVEVHSVETLQVGVKNQNPDISWKSQRACNSSSVIEIRLAVKSRLLN